MKTIKRLMIGLPIGLLLAIAYLLEWLLRPGKLAIPSIELGRAMLEISARVGELANGTLIDNADSIAYAEAYLR